MTRMLAVWAGAALALIGAGAVSGVVPAAWFPDVGLLVAVALGLYRPGASGLLLAWAIGWTEDLLYAAPLGQYALLRMLAWSTTRIADRSIQIQQLGILIGLVSFVTVIDALLLFAIERGFGLTAGLEPSLLARLLPRLLVNALTAAAVGRLVLWGLGDRAERPGARGTLRLEPR